MNTPTQIIAGGLIRVIQGFVAAAPTLLVGLLIAAILRYYLGRDGIRRLFGGDSLRSLPQSWLVGMLLPVCSIGVLPILREMRRAGVKPGAMSAFALAAPLFNPLSLLYGLTLGRPLVIIFFAVGSLIIVTTLGLVWDWLRWRAGDAPEQAAPDARPIATGQLIGFRRIAASAVYIGREATGPTLALTFLALLGLAILAAVLPYGGMQSSVERDDPLAPLTMLVVAVPIYATPMLAMSQLGMMFQHANSPGAAFALLILGTGMNLATPFWFVRHYGWRSSVIWLGSLLLIVIGIAYGINKPLIPPGVEPAGHTHAFDIYTNPLSSYDSNLWNTAKEAVGQSTSIGELAALCLLAFVALVGCLVRALRIDEARLSVKPGASGETERRRFDVIVPRRVIGVTMLIGLVALSGVACFAYYPAPDECLEEIAIARAECLSGATSGNKEHALYWLPIWEEWSRRLEVGTFLRHGQVRPYQRMQGYLIRKKLELLEHELEHDPFEQDEVRAVVDSIFPTHRRWVAAFRSEGQ